MYDERSCGFPRGRRRGNAFGTNRISRCRMLIISRRRGDGTKSLRTSQLVMRRNVAASAAAAVRGARV